MNKILSTLLTTTFLASSQLSAQSGTAVFEVEFKSTWSKTTHPVNFPSFPHYSPLIGATHRSSTCFWMPGGIATAGIEQMAETGGTAGLTSEINAAISKGGARGLVRGSGLGSPASIKIRFVADANHPHLTIVTMLAPSPDWFVGLSGLALAKNGRWIDSMRVPATLWDAGTDNGTSYTSANSNTNPKQKIAVINTSRAPFKGYSTSMGTWTVTRVASTQTFGCGTNPKGSMQVVMGEPLLGQSVTLAIHDPGASMARGSTSFLMLGAKPAAFPCGVKIAGFGMSKPGATGEFLLGSVAVLAPGPTWNGSPVQFKLTVPNNNSLVGLTAYLQGGLASAQRLGLAEGLEVLLGK